MSKKTILKIYKALISLYPNNYRKEYEKEMVTVFKQMYRDRKENTFKFMVKTFIDIFKTLPIEYYKTGILNSIEGKIVISVYNYIGAIFLIPIFALLLADFITRIIQGNLLHPNNQVMNWLNHTFIYNKSIIFIWVLAFPILALLLNIIPILNNRIRNKEKIISTKNIVSIILILIASGFLLLIKFHDFGPCVMHSILNGNTNISEIISICRKA